MNRQYIPYYLSRGALSLAISFLVFGLFWKSFVISIFFFGLFLLYLHSGWFQVDLTNPIFPLRRDPRGYEIQRKALISSILTGVLLFIFLTAIPLSTLIYSIIFIISILVYFGMQFVLFVIT